MLFFSLKSLPMQFDVFISWLIVVFCVDDVTVIVYIEESRKQHTVKDQYRDLVLRFVSAAAKQGNSLNKPNQTDKVIPRRPPRARWKNIQLMGRFKWARLLYLGPGFIGLFCFRIGLIIIWLFFSEINFVKFSLLVIKKKKEKEKLLIYCFLIVFNKVYMRVL